MFKPVIVCAKHLRYTPNHIHISFTKHFTNKCQVSVKRCCSSVVKAGPNYVQAATGGRYVPFAKDLFLGKFDKNMLVFPEVLESAELEQLNNLIQPIEIYFSEKLDSASIDENAEIPPEVLQHLKDLGLFGMQIPPQYGGLGLNATKFARINELCSGDASIAVTLSAHQAIGLKGILLFGTTEQKEKYLPKLASGEHIAAFCLTEQSSGSDAASIQSRATLSEDKKTYQLNGSKIWITNGGLADIFIVFAKTQVVDDLGKRQDKMSAFIVERGFGGVTSGKAEDKLGIRGSNTCEVSFEDTPVPAENVIGAPGDGFKLAMTILNSSRFNMGSSSAGGIRKLMSELCEHAVSRKQFGKTLNEFGLIQEKFAKMAVSAYVMESMSYVTASILDTYDNPDTSMEAAMVKIYSSEQTLMCMNEAVQIMGGAGYMKGYPYERYLRDAKVLSIFEGTDEILRMYVALTGLQHAGQQYQDTIRKRKDAFSHWAELSKDSFVKGMKKSIFSKYSLKLYDQVHPSLASPAENLEMKIDDFAEMVHVSLNTYRDRIIDEQLVCKRLADVCTDLFAMTCVMARASRAKSIGLKNCDHEIMLATVFCMEACDRIDLNIKQLKLNIVGVDEGYKNIAKDVFLNGGYVAEHPLTRNWN